MTSTLERPAVRPPVSATRRSRGWQLTVGLGVLGFLAAFTGSWIPSFWGDEAASVMSAERSLPSLFAMLRSVDAVHGVYYVFLHFWIEVFGASEVSVRLPSAIAVGVMCAGVFVLGRTLVSRNFGIVAAVIAAVLPRTSYMGADARSYAMTAALAVWATIFLLWLLRTRFRSTVRRRMAWIAYSLITAFGAYLFLYLGLLLVVHGVYVLSSRSERRHARTWVKAAAIAVALSLPILGFGYAQRAQIAFLSTRGYATPKSVLESQWFGNPYLAVAAWGFIVLAVAVAIVGWRRTRVVTPLSRLGLAWVLIPTAALLALNAITPAYNLRYVSFCIPGVALAVAAGVWSLRRRTVYIVAALGLVALALPTLVAQRGPYAKDGGSDLAQSAEYIGTHAKAGDAIVFDRTTANRQRPRLAEHLYPQDFTGLDDVALHTPYLKRSELWDTTYPTSDISARLTTHDRIWLVELVGSPDYTGHIDIDALRADGYTATARHLVHRTVIYSLVKS